MKVRLAQVGDIARLQQAIAQADAEVSAKFGHEPASAWIGTAVASAVREGQGVVVAVDDAGDLAGYVAWVALPGFPAGVVHGLGTWVAPAERRTGLATEMRRMAAIWWREHGGRYVEGVAATGNEAGLRSVELLGFRPVGTVVRLDLTGGAA